MDLRGRLRVTGTTISGVDIAEAWRRALPAMLRTIRIRAFSNLSGRLVGVRRGDLRGSLREVIESRGGRLPAGRVGSTDFKGAIFEGGAAAHDIGPGAMDLTRGRRGPRGRPYRLQRRGGRLLRFQIGGRWITTALVRHPGIRPRRWLATALDESLPDMDRILMLELQRSFEQRVRGRIPIGAAR